MRKNVTERAASYQFETLAEMGRYIADNGNRTWPYRQAEDNPPAEDWDLGCGYKEAVRMAQEGWLEGARKAEAALAQFAPKDTAPDTQTDFYGHMPHVARFCAGAPDSMIRHSRKASAGGGRVLTLYVAVCANGGVKADAMANLGIAVAQCVNELETNKGLRVEVHGTATSYISGMTVTHTWRIKDAGQPLDLAVLAFSIGHPAVLRRLEFALCERSAARPSPGYGSAGTTTLGDLIDPPAGAYVLNGMMNANSIAKTPADALAYVQEKIAGLIDDPDAE